MQEIEEINTTSGGYGRYTKKITTPVYEPKNIMPSLSDLYNTSKRDELIAEILSQNLPDEIKRFLISSAERHVVFNFSKIADFYAHAPKNIKELMEQSALVIIDYDKAIQNGFCKYEKEITADLEKALEEKGETW